MKDIKMLFIAFVILYILMATSCSIETNWHNRALELQEIGYSKQASEHIAKVEFGIIPQDEEYISLIED